MSFKGFALLTDKLLIADSQRMEIAAFQVREADATRIVGDLAQGNRDSIQGLGQPISSLKCHNDQELVTGFAQELSHLNDPSWNPNQMQGQRAGAHVT